MGTTSKYIISTYYTTVCNFFLYTYWMMPRAPMPSILTSHTILYFGFFSSICFVELFATLIIPQFCLRLEEIQNEVDYQHQYYCINYYYLLVWSQRLSHCLDAFLPLTIYSSFLSLT
jgi:hypothetical protein